MFNFKKILILAVLLISGSLAAQSTPSPTPTFTTSTDVVGIYYQKAWSLGTEIKGSYDLMDFGTTKANHLFVTENNLLAPTPGLNMYLLGVEFQPNTGNFLSKTNLPPNSIQLFFGGSVGNGIPSTGSNAISFLAGGGARYNFNSSVSWNSIQAQYGQFGSQRFAVLSSGIILQFGAKLPSTTVTTSAKPSIPSPRQ